MVKKRYADLDEVFRDLLAGVRSPEALKPITAPYGIYQQRNGAFMTRVRITGGELDVATFARLADVAERGGGRVHLSSRQDVQIHDLSAGRVMATVRACDRLGLPFQGGGGNTFRNVLVGSDSGLTAEASFDVYPYAQALCRAMKRCPKAFSLPRKLKVGLFAGDADRLRASIQDLGFLARVRDGVPGFEVWACGGMGRESAVGTVLFRFLPASQIARATVALADLFFDHGDRANRQQARLRFLLRRLGAEEFLRLYLEYFAQAKAPDLRVSDVDRVAGWAVGLVQGGDGTVDAGFESWSRVAVSPTRLGEDVVSVRIFVPYGNLTARQMRAVAAAAAAVGTPVLRLLASQDMLLPVVHRSALRGLYGRLTRELGDLDFACASYRGHIATCVGATVCKVGMADASAVADALADALDAYLPPDTPERLALFRLVTDGLRVSGCPNSCSGHPASRVGVGCVNQRVGEVVRPFARIFSGSGADGEVPRLCGCETALLPLDEAVRATVAACCEATCVAC